MDYRIRARMVLDADFIVKDVESLDEAKHLATLRAEHGVEREADVWVKAVTITSWDRIDSGLEPKEES